MLTIAPVAVLHLPISRQVMGFSPEGDRGNAVLLLADEMPEATYAAYQQAGCIHEGVCISGCEELLFTVLEQMQVSWCPWPDRAFTLAVLPSAQMAILADRLVLASLPASTDSPPAKETT